MGTLEETRTKKQITAYTLKKQQKSYRNANSMKLSKWFTIVAGVVLTSVFMFIGAMFWYRLGLSLPGTGEADCGCLGKVAAYLALDAKRENLIALAALGVLGACVSPGILLKVRQFFPNRTALPFAIVCLFLAGANAGKAEVLDVRGTYTHAFLNSRTGKVLEKTLVGLPTRGVTDFQVLMGSNSWRISVTNRENAELWTELTYDGTDLFVLTPQVWPFIEEKQAKEERVLVTISESQYYVPSASDMAFAFLPWLTYGLNPSLIGKRKDNLIGIPLPWDTPRKRVAGFGWNWALDQSKDGRFLASARIVKDSRLDLRRPNQELLRPEFNYPETFEAKNAFLDSLAHRRGIPDGFTNTVFQSTKWLNTNQMQIPIASEVQHFMWMTGEYPYFTASLVAETVELHSKEPLWYASTESLRIVEDYRYRRFERSRIFRFAKYTLGPGEAWRGPNDPELLAQAAYHIKHGERYNHYESSFRHWLLWSIGIALLAVPLVIALRMKGSERSKPK